MEKPKEAAADADLFCQLTEYGLNAAKKLVNAGGQVLGAGTAGTARLCCGVLWRAVPPNAMLSMLWHLHCAG